MKLYWIHPERDETLTFDLPDGAKCFQVGARCGAPGCHDRFIVAIDGQSYRCARWPSDKEQTAHTDWLPGVTYRIERVSDTEYVARVSEGDAHPAFTAYPVAVTPGTVRA